MSGLLGFGAAYHAMHECDLLLLLGTDFPYDKFLPTKPKIVQVDIRVDNLGRRSKLDLGLWGDVGETINALLPMVDAKSDRWFLDAMLNEHKNALIDVVTGPNALSLPSHISADQVVGFGLAMGKLVLAGGFDEVMDTIETNIRNI
jgi:thiamine pyrophosphate-dependent acetolactate synthase large subunit-like protein